MKVVFALSVITFAFLMLLGRGCRIGHPVIAFYIASLVVMMIRSAPELREMTGGLYLLGAAVTLCFITDIAAYLAGRAFGRHKIAPVISPNKTVEGAFAGILAAVVCGELLGCLMEGLGILEVDYAMLAVYSALASVAGQFGDFAMSAVKRVCGLSVLLALMISPEKALTCLIVYLAIQFIETQFIYPRVVGGSVGLSPLWTLAAVLIGGKLFGLIGMIFFIPLVSVAYILISEDVRSRLRKRAELK
ncbi:MAG TPA: AI-2E family transporter [Candidatus Copromorpha excrementigallinarum]|uniref:Phosphatidate cytidylyltransferase n=1 Tax=Candidatus Allocopromorpha excrementigallinarum TaxID=2840742 RepID=A0A9D1L5T3_9FIRM|nr:AI-2E family transporter [Candidatus Copromorpha excrementigallinarum]